MTKPWLDCRLPLPPLTSISKPMQK